MKIKLFITAFLLLVLLVRCSDPNYPPTLVELVASSSLVETGQEIVLSCLAMDLDDDSLTYTWSSSAGIFKHGNETDSVFWVAPSIEGNYQIEVGVSDGKKTTIGSLDIFVIPEIITGEFTDERDGSVYTFASIGTQIWMTENLAWLPDINAPDSGSVIEPLYYVYGFTTRDDTVSSEEHENYKKYGALYNFQAALIACPDGWHLPTSEESDTLVNFLGFDPGYQMKSQQGWAEEGSGSNSSMFNALPAGYRYFEGQFGGINEYAYFWTTTITRSDYPIMYYMSSTSDEVFQGPTQYPSYGFSVRCIKNK